MHRVYPAERGADPYVEPIRELARNGRCVACTLSVASCMRVLVAHDGRDAAHGASERDGAKPAVPRASEQLRLAPREVVLCT